MYLRVIGFDLSLRLPLRLSSLLMSVRPCDDDATTVAVVAVVAAVDGKNLVVTILGDADDGGDDAVAVDASAVAIGGTAAEGANDGDCVEALLVTLPDPNRMTRFHRCCSSYCQHWNNVGDSVVATDVDTVGWV